ncbi:hypothetical protein, partial [Rathayibacter toxicus]|uniref:hypothetical protein n=1 Tax=Rathayibacter toxicus TaxID=145458 RepID=UPI000AA28B64
MITNIDVTLRDGGYRNSFSFPQEYAIAHARLSVAAGFDWIEIGYRAGSLGKSAGTGLTSQCNDNYIRAIAEATGTQYVGIMAHPSNLSETDLEDAWVAGARLLRVCLSPQNPQPGLECAKKAKNLGCG